jgi:threonine dehydratase
VALSRYRLDVPHPVAVAAERLAGVAHRTPVVTCGAIDAAAGVRVYLKCESFQRVGAFKLRGAYNALASLTAQERARGVITHSSGNHAQGLALAARLLGVTATVVMPHDAPPIKRRATEGYGARIVACDARDREAVCAAEIEAHGSVLIHPYDDERIIAGAGTAAWELFDQVDELDALFVPVGGGGLSSGSCLAAAERSPSCRVVGVEPEGADDARHSLAAGRVVTLDAVPTTIADGLRTRAIGERNLAVLARHLAEMVVVSDDRIVAALRLLWERAKLVVEPSGAAALAGLLAGCVTLPDNARVGVILSGGNVEPALLATLLA